MTKIRLHKLVKDIIKKHFLEYSNPETQANIQEYGVYVDGVLIKKRLEWVYTNQKINFNHWPKRQASDFSEVKEIYQDQSLVVLFKPPLVVSDLGTAHQKDNLLVWARQKYTPNLFLVNRLDKNTQGLILLAKGEDNQKFYQDQFRKRLVRKKYLVVLQGLLVGRLEVQAWQSRDLLNPIKQKFFWEESKAITYSPKAREAKSIFKPLVYSPNQDLSLVQVEILTGRMHQIRLQAEAIGHPVLFDAVYNKKLDPPKHLQSLLEIDEEVKKINPKDFQNLIQDIFQARDFLLLSNYIRLTKKDGSELELKYKNLDFLARK